MPERTEKTRVSAYGLIHDDEQMLLCRLSAQVVGHAGYWTLPGGGLDFGEHPEAAVVREVYEETGLHVRPTRVVTVDNLYFPDEGFHNIRILYDVQLIGTTIGDTQALKAEQDGTTDICAWLSHHDCTQLPLVSLAALGVRLCLES